MKKIDVIRMIASMPDETQVYFNDGTQVITIDRAEYVIGRLVFSVAPTATLKQAAKSIIKDTGIKLSVEDGELKVRATK